MKVELQAWRLKCGADLSEGRMPVSVEIGEVGQETVCCQVQSNRKVKISLF